MDVRPIPSTHCYWCENRTLPFGCSNPACRDRGFHPVTMLTETCQAPKVEAQTSPGDRVQMSSGSRHGEPAIGAIGEPLGVIRYVLRVPPVEKIG